MGKYGPEKLRIRSVTLTFFSKNFTGIYIRIFYYSLNFHENNHHKDVRLN